MDASLLFYILKHIFIFAAFNGLLLIALLIRSGKKQRANYVLAAWVTCLVAELSWNSLKVGDFFYHNPDWIFAMLELDHLYGPLFLLYVVMKVENATLRWWYLLLLSPFFITLYLNIQAFLEPSEFKLLHFESNMAGDLPRGVSLYEIFYFLSPFASYILAFNVVHKANKQHEYSVNDDAVRKDRPEALAMNKMQWLYRFSVLQIVAWLSVLIVCTVAIVLSPHPLTPALVMASYLPYAAVLYFLSGLSLWQERDGLANEQTHLADVQGRRSCEPVKKYQKQKLSDARANQLKVQLTDYMQEHRPYLDNELALTDLSEQLGVSPHQLSQLLNQHFQQSFYDFINEYRIEEIKRRLSDPSVQNETILSLALEAGFNSKATFNTVFKRKEKMTPSAYRRQFC